MTAILFDIGGTILDDRQATPAYLSVLRESLIRHGCYVSAEQFQEVTLSLMHTFVPRLRRALAWYFTKPDIATCDLVMRETNAALPDLIRRYPRTLYPGIADVLADLAGRFPLALAGNAPSAIREDLERLGILHYFARQEVSEDIGFSKPDPRFFAHILEALGIAPEEALMIGDRLDNDIIPARALGLKGLWVRQGEYAVLEPRIPEEIPEATVTDVAQIPQAVESISQTPVHQPGWTALPGTQSRHRA